MKDLYQIDPTSLSTVRLQTHAACQWMTKAARANLPAVTDDSHSNFGWQNSANALVSRPLDERGHALGFSFEQGAMMLFEGQTLKETLALNGVTEQAAGNWTDMQLESLGLQTTTKAEMPYELEAIEHYDFDGTELSALGRWFQLGFDVLSKVVEALGHIAVAEPSVRCWPHHYDVGTLLLLDDEGPETARSIGIGLSPGDGSYTEPYFYCSPWPVPDLAGLGAAPDGLQWHTDGFVSLVATASALRSVDDPSAVVAAGVEQVENVLK